MKITVTGSLGNISKPLTEKLVAAGHTVTLISSDPAKAAAIEALGATPAIGSVEDASFLQSAFTGAEAVYTMVPPNFKAADWKASIGQTGAGYATAIRNAGIKHVVNLSSMGAHLPGGVGPVSGLYKVEHAMNALEDVNVLHLQPGFFYTNFYGNVDMIKHANILGANYAGNDQLAMAAPADIATVAAQALINLDFTGKSTRFVASAVHSNAEVAAILGKGIGKPSLPWVEFTDEEALAGMQQAGLPQEIAANYVEMGTAVRSGKMFELFFKESAVVNGRVSLEDFAVEFAKSFS